MFKKYGNINRNIKTLKNKNKEEDRPKKDWERKQNYREKSNFLNFIKVNLDYMFYNKWLNKNKPIWQIQEIN